MKLVAKHYKDIENNEYNEFANNIMYVYNLSLIGFGLQKNNTGSSHSYIYIDIALRLDDLRSIIKLVLMYEADQEEAKNFVNSALSIPDRGITGYCPVMVMASDSFVKDKDEYYIYAVNGRPNQDKLFYTLSFDFVSMLKIQYIISLVEKCVQFKEDITYTKCDKYEEFHKDTTKLINLVFTNQFEVLGFVLPPKKLFESSVNCLCLSCFNHNREKYYIYFYTTVKSSDRKSIKDNATYDSNKPLLDKIKDNCSFMIQDNVNISYYNKGASVLTNKVIMFGNRRDRLEKVILIFTEDNYKSFCESVTDYMKK